MSGGVNVALGKTVTTFSIDGIRDGARLVDDNLDTIYHSKTASNEWASIDLAVEYPIDQIIVYNRKDGWQGRIIGSKVQIINGTNTIVWTSDAFPSKKGGTAAIDGQFVTDFSTFTMSPPSTIVVGG